MKKGDLVELSAYGKKLKILENLRGDIGIVVDPYFNAAQVMWARRGFRHMNRRDIKRVRVNEPDDTCKS